MILDDCFVVRHGSVSWFGEEAKHLLFTIKVDLCSELLFVLGHTIETCLVFVVSNSSFLDSRFLFSFGVSEKFNSDLGNFAWRAA